ncbi:MAG: glycerol-3-phosphate 1-O-acyltransferase [Acidobacteria bacterium]|nr:MAG: glycerol-3-phosphate 1-O-acyltransferase [Acidobacteriota bacterium]REK04328.1 MAG: glycerol-3-phosphate 1-O-acyltransferase [Acidobacteriota bacterium]
MSPEIPSTVPGAVHAAAAVLAAYLLGSVSFSYLIVRLLRGVDIRTVGSGNAGATNVLRVAGTPAGICALVLDIGKGVAAVVVARLLDVGPVVIAAVGVAAVLGHMYPVFFGLRGGKGVATAAGTLGSLAPLATLASLVVFLLVVAWKRYVSLGSIVVAATCPAFMVLLPTLRGRPVAWPLVAGAVAIGLLVTWKHRANIGRLLRGEEKRLGERAEVTSPPPGGEGGQRA